MLKVIILANINKHHHHNPMVEYMKEVYHHANKTKQCKQLCEKKKKKNQYLEEQTINKQS